MCAILKSEGLIKKYETVPMSGKMQITFKNGKKKNFGNKFDVAEIATDRPDLLNRLRSHLQTFSSQKLLYLTYSPKLLLNMQCTSNWYRVFETRKG